MAKEEMPAWSGTALLCPAWSPISGRERKFLRGDVEFVTGSGKRLCGQETSEQRGPWRGVVKALCWKINHVVLHQH